MSLYGGNSRNHAMIENKRSHNFLGFVQLACLIIIFKQF
jgi:hypothetical protein